MSRILLDKGKQKDFLNKIHKTSALEWVEIANICNVSERTIRDWRREKFYMKYEAAQTLSQKTQIPLFKPKRILPEYWSTKKAASVGAQRRYEIYGNPGTPEGRRKGGINSQRLFRLNPEYAKKLGIKIRKTIKKPRPSIELAEFIGIMLGDGGISNYQINLTFNAQTDSEYTSYVQKLIKKLFLISTSITLIPLDNANRIVASSRNLVEFLEKKGLEKNNKIKNIPQWILNNRSYSIACLRGLVDTDGSFYSYRHKVNGKKYINFTICFTNHSHLILNSVYKILNELNFKPHKTGYRIYLNRKNDIATYLNIIKTNNPKHLNKYKRYIKERYGSGYNRTVSKTV